MCSVLKEVSYAVLFDITRPIYDLEISGYCIIYVVDGWFMESKTDSKRYGA